MLPIHAKEIFLPPQGTFSNINPLHYGYACNKPFFPSVKGHCYVPYHFTGKYNCID